MPFVQTNVAEAQADLQKWWRSLLSSLFWDIPGLTEVWNSIYFKLKQKS